MDNVGERSWKYFVKGGLYFVHPPVFFWFSSSLLRKKDVFIEGYPKESRRSLEGFTKRGGHYWTIEDKGGHKWTNEDLSGQKWTFADIFIFCFVCHFVLFIFDENYVEGNFNHEFIFQ